MVLGGDVGVLFVGCCVCVLCVVVDWYFVGGVGWVDFGVVW